MNYVKTYELFGLFGKKKGVSKNVKSFLAHEKGEKAKKDEYEEKLRLAREKSEEDDRKFKERIKSTIEGISYPIIDKIKVEIDGRNITAFVKLDVSMLNSFINLFKKGNNLSFKDIEPRQPLIQMEFSIKPDWDKNRVSYGPNKSKEYMGIYHHKGLDRMTLYMKDVIDYKGNVGREELRNISGDYSFDRDHPIISYEKGQNDINLSQIENSIIYTSSQVGGMICREIYKKIEYFKKLKEFEIISSFTDDEVKDYMSDLIDISNDYKIQRFDESIVIELEILGLRKYDGKMRMTKLNSQVVKYLTEIQGRLEERELEIDVKFGHNKLGIRISKMEGEQNEQDKTTHHANPGPRRA